MAQFSTHRTSNGAVRIYSSNIAILGLCFFQAIRIMKSS